MGVHRITKFVKYLSRQYWNIHVITIHPTKHGRKDFSLLRDIPASVHIQRTASLRTIREQKRIDRIWFLIDYYMKWYPKAIITGKYLIEKYSIDVIFASYPWASHFIIAYFLSKLTNRPLVVDYRDNWEKNMFLISPVLNRLEHWILKQCHQVIFNNYHTYSLYSDKYIGIIEGKSTVIENGYDHEDKSLTKHSANQHFNIVYAGNPYNVGIQRPFLLSIKELAEEEKINRNDFKVTFVGYQNNIDKKYIYSNNISQFFRLVGDVTHIDSVNIQMTADLLLVFSNFPPAISKWCTPGKFFEYLGVEKPILLIADKDSAMADYLRWTRSGFLVRPHDTEEIKNTIMTVYQNWRNSRACLLAQDPILPRDHFDVEDLSNKLADILKRIIE